MPRGEPLVQPCVPAGLEHEVTGGAAEQLRERARRRDGRTFMPSGRRRQPRRWRCRAADGGASAPAPAGSHPRGLAGGDQGQRAAERLRPPDPAPGGDDRGAGASPRPRGRGHRAAAGRRLLAAVVRGELAGTELERRLDRSALAERVAVDRARAPGRRAAALPPRPRTHSPSALREEAAAGWWPRAGP